MVQVIENWPREKLRTVYYDGCHGWREEGISSHGTSTSFPGILQAKYI